MESSLEVLAFSARMSINETRASPMLLAVVVFQPVTFLLIALLPMADPTPEQGTRVAMGVLLSAFWSSTVWGSASVLRRERFGGTLARALAGLMDARLIVLGKGLGSSMLTIAVTIVSVVVTLLLLRQSVLLDHAGLIVLGLLVVVASGAAVGLLVGSIFVVTRYGPAVSSALMYPVILLGGMLIPLEVLPGSVRWLSSMISLRWLQEWLTSSAYGKPNLTALLIGVALTIGYAVGGAWLFGRVALKARRDGTLDLY